ncbi:hypothetical protein ACNQ2B_02675 [Mycoplasma sp. Z707]|uniref:hypothetical protein n=1 Tax=Mycoplasma sp. Z707 TaxID=3401691 RepID=UPI003AAF99E5
MYKTDGSSHNNGVNGESSILRFLNDEKNFIKLKEIFEKHYNIKILYSFNFNHRGGTKNREDVYDENNKIKISIKSKKKTNKYKGTFDLLNTSRLLAYTDLDNLNFNKSLGRYEKTLKYISENKISDKAIVSNYVNAAIFDIFENLDNGVVPKIFKNIDNIEKNIITVIRDYKSSISEVVTFDKLHFLKNNWFSNEMNIISSNKVVVENKKKSGRIHYTNGQLSPFRLRITLNNGVGALMVSLGVAPRIEGKNTSSSLTFKIQVDDISEIIRKYEIKN